MKEYFIDRASRMYSVVLPALSLTLVCYWACLAINRDLYLSIWGDVSNYIPIRLIFNLLFISQAWGHNTIPLIDAPFWSLGYEVPYYVLYGIIFYMSGVKRTVAVILWIVLLGPPLLFLLPIWWLGCWVYDAYISIRNTAGANVLRWATLTWLGLGLVLLSFGKSSLISYPVRLVIWIQSLPEPPAFLHLTSVRSNMMAFSTGVVAAGLLFVALLLTDWIRIEAGNIWARRFRHLADGTFTIYLLHYPLFALATITGLFAPDSHLRTILTASAICILLISLAPPLDNLKNWMRRLLRSSLAGPSESVKRRADKKVPA